MTYIDDCMHLEEKLGVRQMIRTVLRIADIVKALDGIPDRLALQKTVYLLEKMGLDIGCKYKWYTLGPYSSDLANEMFEGLSTGVLTASDDGYTNFRVGEAYHKLRQKIPQEFSENTRQIMKLKEVFGKNLADSAMLECAGSLLYLLQDRWPPAESKNEALEELERLKQGKFDANTKRKAWQYLQDLQLA